MIVFCLFLLIMSFSIILLLSNLMLDIKKIEIKDLEDLKKIYCMFCDKKYYEIFNYIAIRVDIKIDLLSIIPVKLLSINNQTIKKVVRKIMLNALKEKKDNIIKYKIKKEKQIIKIKQIKRKINSHLKIKEADLNLEIGLTNAGVTAIATGFLNIIMSMILMDFIFDLLEIKTTDKTIEPINKTINNLNYIVKPIYSDDFAFNLESNLKLEFPINALI